MLRRSEQYSGSCRRTASRFPTPASRFPLPASRHPLPATRFPPPGSRFPLPASRFPLRASRFALPVARCPLPATGWALPATRRPLPAARYQLENNHRARRFDLQVCTNSPLVGARRSIRCPGAIERWRRGTVGEAGFRVSDFRKLRVWQAAQELAIDVYRVAAGMRGRSTTLRDQLMRAAISVPTNIVEGSAHESEREFARFLRYSLASVSELEGHLQLARDLRFVADSEFNVLLSRVVDVRKMLHGLLKKLKAQAMDNG